MPCVSLHVRTARLHASIGSQQQGKLANGCAHTNPSAFLRPLLTCSPRGFSTPGAPFGQRTCSCNSLFGQRTADWGYVESWTRQPRLHVLTHACVGHGVCVCVRMLKAGRCLRSSHNCAPMFVIHLHHSIAHVVIATIARGLSALRRTGGNTLRSFLKRWRSSGLGWARCSYGAGHDSSVECLYGGSIY
jgi:hypothetical protein